MLSRQTPLPSRTCGSCRCFHASPAAPGQGLCVHPGRRHLYPNVLVREKELACRDGRGRSLWATAGTLGPLALDPRNCGWPRFPLVVNDVVEGVQ